MTPEEVHSLAIMACLSGEPLPDEAKAHLKDADFRAEVEMLAALESELFDAGDLLSRHVPSVNLVSSIQAKLQMDATGTVPPTEDEELISTHLNAALDDISKARLERRLSEDPELQSEWASLQQTSDALQELADMLEQQEEDIDIVEAVLDAVRKHHDSSVLLELDPATESLEDALFELGAEVNHHAPVIDIRDDILAAVQQAKINEADNITAFGVKHGKKGSSVQGAAAPQTARWKVWTGYAAAAAIIFAMGIATQAYLNQGTTLPANENLANRTELVNFIKNGKVSRAIIPTRPAESAEQAVQLNAEGEPILNADGEVQGITPSLQDILDARRKALVDDENALASLAEWAALSPAEALAVLQKSGYSAESILGVLPYLDEEQSLAILKDAVSKFPRDSQLRFALAKELLDSEDFLSARQQLEQWSKLDPENGLPVYMDAQVLLAQGDVEGARLALYDASQYDSLDTFSMASAQYHRDALIASGIDPDAATLLAGMNAFNGDYSELRSLGDSLLNEGTNLKNTGDYTGAAEMYKSAGDLGREIAESSSFPNEAGEGVSLQAEAALYMDDILQYLSAEEASYYANQEIQVLMDSFALLEELYGAINSLYNGDIEGVLSFLSSAFENPEPIFNFFD